MGQSLSACADITINASAVAVWKALTDPQEIKKYLFGTEAVTDWKVGSPIVFRGVWQGQAYEDKGTILEIAPQRRLRYSFWSSFSGKEYAPENTSIVTFDLSSLSGSTRLAVAQDNVTDEKAREHSQQNWATVLQELKRLLETA